MTGDSCVFKFLWRSVEKVWKTPRKLHEECKCMVIAQDLWWKVKEWSFFNKQEAEKSLADYVLCSKETDPDSSFQTPFLFMLALADRIKYKFS